MNVFNSILDRRKAIGFLATIVIIIGVLGLVNIISSIPETYYYEASLPKNNTRDTRFTITGVNNANISISFVDEPGLWYRIEMTHYTSGKRHSVENVTTPSFLPLRVQVTSVTPVKTLNIILGTDAIHSLYISGSNLNTIVVMDNGAKISGSRCRFYGTGIFQFVMTENINYTTKGMDVEVGDFFLSGESPELVILDIDLPVGMNGHLSSHNTTFIHNDWQINYGNEWGTVSIDEPLVDIEIYYAQNVVAELRT
ncbi:MAG: hypothetical protein ACFFFK_01095 [Candidatus Thorarchaeota archaeon]